MAFRQADIQSYSRTTTLRKSLREAQNEGRIAAFLSHSHQDAEMAKGLQAFLQTQGWRVYIDWEDAAMPERPTRRTAERIQEKIRGCNVFLFLATSNSMSSRWCPWEIGYADGVKRVDSILVIPTQDGWGTVYGNE